MDAENIIVIRTDSSTVAATIAQYLSAKGFKQKVQEPIKQITGFVPIAKRKRRLFFIDEYYAKLTCVTEMGTYADQELSQYLSDVLQTDTFWLALHESLNAWGVVHSHNGTIRYRAMHPAHLFTTASHESAYDGDATEEAMSYAQSIGDFEPFVNYQQIANGLWPERIIERIHLAFVLQRKLEEGQGESSHSESS